MGGGIRFGRAVSAVAAAAVALLGLQATAEIGTPELISAASDGSPGNANSYEGAVTPNGRFVAFDSRASNLHADATGAVSQVFVRDLQTGEIELISASADGVAGNGHSYNPCISANGRYVLFESGSDNLVTPDANGAEWDVYLYDRKTGEMRIVSESEAGVQGDGDSRIYGNSLTPNGRLAVFTSAATNLVPGADNGFRQIYVKDLRKGTVTLVSVDGAGNEGDNTSNWPSLSPNGKWAAFQSLATNLVPPDTNSDNDILVADLRHGTLARATVGHDGSEADGGGSAEPAISNNGKIVVFYSSATNLVPGDDNGQEDVFLRDLGRGTTTRLSERSDGVETNGTSYEACLTSSGKIVVYYTNATNLDPDLAMPNGGFFLYDVKHGTNTPILLGPGGAALDGSPYVWPWSLTPTGNWLLFATEATQFTTGNTGGYWQVYLVRMR